MGNVPPSISRPNVYSVSEFFGQLFLVCLTSVRVCVCLSVSVCLSVCLCGCCQVSILWSFTVILSPNVNPWVNLGVWFQSCALDMHALFRADCKYERWSLHGRTSRERREKSWYPFLKTEPQMFQRKLNDVVSYCVNLFISCALQFSLLRWSIVQSSFSFSTETWKSDAWRSIRNQAVQSCSFRGDTIHRN